MGDLNVNHLRLTLFWGCMGIFYFVGNNIAQSCSRVQALRRSRLFYSRRTIRRERYSTSFVLTMCCWHSRTACLEIQFFSLWIASESKPLALHGRSCVGGILGSRTIITLAHWLLKLCLNNFVSSFYTSQKGKGRGKKQTNYKVWYLRKSTYRKKYIKIQYVLNELTRREPAGKEGCIAS